MIRRSHCGVRLAIGFIVLLQGPGLGQQASRRQTQALSLDLTYVANEGFLISDWEPEDID